ncbi:MAG: pilus assembly protein CpaB [Micromonosporaceae bacterium]|jgi:pilus assembly protein CpaB|nr:pilus assembly protein CpaB [Micromonosporaceae bacterium]
MKRSVVAIAVAAVLAVLGCATVLVYVRSADSRALAGQRAVTVLVAAKRIPIGTSGSQIRSGGYVESVTMPQSSVPDDAMSSVPSSVDKLAVTAEIAPRQLVLRAAFGQPTTVTGGLALPTGKIAVSVDAQGPVDSFVRPGANIAIFDSFSTDPKSNIPDGEKLSSGKDIHQVTRVLLPRVEVIAVGAKTATSTRTDATSDSSSAGTPTSSAAKTLTVAVDQEQAERLIHAVLTGTLYFALLDDSSEIKPGSGVNNTNLFP